MGVDPKSTEKENVNVWMVVALMTGAVGLLGGPEKGKIEKHVVHHSISIRASSTVMNL